jgi:hypothetical protein
MDIFGLAKKTLLSSDKKKKGEEDFLDIVYSRYKQKTSSGEKMALIDSFQLIHQTLTMIINSKPPPIQIKIDDNILDYYSYLKYCDEEEPDEKPTQENQGLVLIIDALLPPVGNIRILKSKSIGVTLFSQKYQIGFAVEFQKVIDSEASKYKLIQLSFPSFLVLDKQKRGGFRATIKPEWNILCTITRQSGIKYDVELVNLSVGGFCFREITEEASMMDGSKIKCKIRWPEKKINVSVKAKIVGSFTHDGKDHFRNRFSIKEASKCQHKLEELVSLVQIEEAKQRSMLFKQW